MVFDTMYDASTIPGATFTISGHEGPVEVKESVADIERLMNQARAQQSNNEVHLI